MDGDSQLGVQRVPPSSSRHGFSCERWERAPSSPGLAVCFLQRFALGEDRSLPSLGFLLLRYKGVSKLATASAP